MTGTPPSPNQTAERACAPDRTVLSSTHLEASYTPRITRSGIGKRCEHPQLAIQPVWSPSPGRSTCRSCAQRRTGEDSTTENGTITNLTNGLGVSPTELTSRPEIAPDEDREMVELSRGASLLLTARERVLSLSEQRARCQSSWHTLSQGN